MTALENQTTGILNATERFTNRTEEYRRHRPGSPPQVIDILKEKEVIDSSSVVADIGAGTGLSSKLFLPHVSRVYGVEPNAAMRRQAEIDLADGVNFLTVDGSAEATTLADASIDLIVAAQAFHWFDKLAAFQEFRRILKPQGHVLLMWNERDTEGDALQAEYEAMLQSLIPNYCNLVHKSLKPEVITAFFNGAAVTRFSLANEQIFSLEALKGRMMSSSYIPKPPSLVYDALSARLEVIFSCHQQNGVVRFAYRTNGYFGHLI
jgi:SAM-dependent methyltransferase